VCRWFQRRAGIGPISLYGRQRGAPGRPAYTPMIGAAKEAGQYHSEGWDQKYPKVQILTIERLLADDRPNLPPPYKKKGGA
jgi:hypothetical protein